MTKLKMLLLAAAAAVPGTVALVAPAAAQVAGIAVANPDGAVANSRAWTAARGQIQTTYKTQLDQADARRRAIAAELQPLYAAFEAARGAPNANQAALRTQATNIQTRETAGNQEIGRLTAPAQRAQAYALEQISAQLTAAVTAATTRKNVSLLLRPEAVIFAQPTTDITRDITTELDRLVPTVGVTPPANWQPGAQQGAAGAATPGAAPTPAPAAPRPNQGR